MRNSDIIFMFNKECLNDGGDIEEEEENDVIDFDERVLIYRTLDPIKLSKKAIMII